MSSPKSTPGSPGSPVVPLINEPSPVQTTQTQQGQPPEITVNRWLMRIMRLGGLASTGSSGYNNQANLAVNNNVGSRTRRRSVAELTSATGLSSPGSSSLLRPPVASFPRSGRRFSDCLSVPPMMVMQQQRSARSRKGKSVEVRSVRREETGKVTVNFDGNQKP